MVKALSKRIESEDIFGVGVRYFVEGKEGDYGEERCELRKRGLVGGGASKGYWRIEIRGF